MFGFGFSELITVIIVLIILINPREMPKIAKTAGRIYAAFIRHINGVKRSFKDFSDEIEELTITEGITKKEEEV